MHLPCKYRTGVAQYNAASYPQLLANANVFYLPMRMFSQQILGGNAWARVNPHVNRCQQRQGTEAGSAPQAPGAAYSARFSAQR